MHYGKAIAAKIAGVAQATFGKDVSCWQSALGYYLGVLAHPSVRMSEPDKYVITSILALLFDVVATTLGSLQA